MIKFRQGLPVYHSLRYNGAPILLYLNCFYITILILLEVYIYIFNLKSGIVNQAKILGTEIKSLSHASYKGGLCDPVKWLSVITNERSECGDPV